jgi:DnaJ-class molecular chaperone
MAEQENPDCLACAGRGYWWCDIAADEHIRQTCSTCNGTGLALSENTASLNQHPEPAEPTP